MQKLCNHENSHLGDSESYKEVDDACLLYCERFMEFLIDLLSQLPTRRYLKKSSIVIILTALPFLFFWLKLIHGQN